MKLSKEMIEKLSREDVLSLDEMISLDEALESQSQIPFAEPSEDQLSLAWRSSLNEKLRGLQPLEKKPSLVITVWFRLVGGLALAGVASVALFMSTRSASSPYSASTAQSSKLEEAMISSHLISEATPVSSSAVYAEPVNKRSEQPVTWSRDDLEMF